MFIVQSLAFAATTAQDTVMSTGEPAFLTNDIKHHTLRLAEQLSRQRSQKAYQLIHCVKSVIATLLSSI